MEISSETYESSFLGNSSTLIILVLKFSYTLHHDSPVRLRGPVEDTKTDENDGPHVVVDGQQKLSISDLTDLVLPSPDNKSLDSDILLSGPR